MGDGESQAIHIDGGGENNASGREREREKELVCLCLCADCVFVQGVGKYNTIVSIPMYMQDYEVERKLTKVREVAEFVEAKFLQFFVKISLFRV